jgi:hypothetical protein
MHEALGMARLVRDFLNTNGAQDGGAGYRIIVTDTAGNSAEVWHHDDHAWILEDDVDLPLLRTRLRLDEPGAGR